MTDGPAAISLFSGAGGLDLGVEAAGYNVTAAVEHDRDAALTMEKNFHHPGLAGHPQRHSPDANARDLAACRVEERSAPGPARRRPALHTVLQVWVLAGVEARWPRPQRQPVAGLHARSG